MKNLVRHLLIISSAGLVTAPSVTILAKPPAELNPLVVVAPTSKQNSLMTTQVVSADPQARKLDRQARTQGTSLSPYSATSPDLFSKATTVALNDSTNPTSLSYSAKESQEGETSKAFGISLTLGQTVGLYDRQDSTRDRYIDMEMRLRYRFSSQTSFSFLSAGSIDQNDSDNNGIDSALFSISQTGLDYFSKVNHEKILYFSPYLSINTPVSKVQRDQSFRGALAPGLNFGLGEGALPLKQLSLGFGISFSRNFYAYETSAGGSSNSQYSSVQSMSLGYELSSRINLSLNLRHFNSWSFQGTPGESYSHNQEIDYRISKPVALAIGHTYGNPSASIYKADGQTTNFNLVNEKDSYVYGNLTYTY
jgi:hypothetical protein